MEFTETPSTVDLHTGSGGVKLKVPSGNYDMNLDTGSGSIDIDDVGDDSDSGNSITIKTGSGGINVSGE